MYSIIFFHEVHIKNFNFINFPVVHFPKLEMHLKIHMEMNKNCKHKENQDIKENNLRKIHMYSKVMQILKITNSFIIYLLYFTLKI